MAALTAAARPVDERPPLPRGVAWRAIGASVAATAVLLARRRVHLGSEHVGRRLGFADGASARVYRETVVDGLPGEEPCVLLVEFRLRGIRGRGHAVFRLESQLNTPLFVGFAGFRSKLWLAHDQHDVYRGVYQWDNPVLAERYARCLWHVLALVSVPGSIHYAVLPGQRRDDLLRHPSDLDHAAADTAKEWWRLVQVS